MGEEGDREFGSLIENKNAPSPAQSAEQRLLREDLEKTLIALRPREARVLRLRFGLQGELSHSLEEIGNKIGVTRERARQMITRLGDLGMRISWERVQEIASSGSIGRPHIAQALLEKGYI